MAVPTPQAAAPYAELLAATNFSFLRGASHPFEMVVQAASMGLSGIGICDRNSMSGVVRAYAAARDIAKDFPAFKMAVGARLAFDDGTPDIAVYPIDRAAYGRLCALLTLGNRRAPKGECHLRLSDLESHLEGQLLIVIPRDGSEEADGGIAASLSRLAPGRVWLAALYRADGRDRARLNHLAIIAKTAEVPMLATTEPLYHHRTRGIVQDVVTCIREGVMIAYAGFLLAPNHERFIYAPGDMERAFRDHPQALAETTRLISRITFTLDQLRYIYPEETVGNGETAQQTLGLTLVAVGTSMPEFATSVMAAIRGNGDVAFGNVVGSNIFNALGILGGCALISPVAVSSEFLRFDVWVMVGTAVLLVGFATTGWRLSRREGVVFLATYGLYLVAQLATSGRDAVALI